MRLIKPVMIVLGEKDKPSIEILADEKKERGDVYTDVDGNLFKSIEKDIIILEIDKEKIVKGMLVTEIGGESFVDNPFVVKNIRGTFPNREGSYNLYVLTLSTEQVIKL